MHPEEDESQELIPLVKVHVGDVATPARDKQN